MNNMRKWIALLLLAVFLPATAMAQSCAARSAYTKQSVMTSQNSAASQQHDEPMTSDHCAKKTRDACPFAAVCDFANLFVLHAVVLAFSPAPLADAPEFLSADFMSVVHPPALRPPTV
jgi:hypothetical protein